MNLVVIILVILLNLFIILKIKIDFFLLKIIFVYFLIKITKIIINYLLVEILIKLININNIFFLIKLKKIFSLKIINKIGFIDIFMKVNILIFISYFLVNNLIFNSFFLLIYLYVIFSSIIFFFIDLKITFIQLLSLLEFDKIKLKYSGILKIKKYKQYLLTGTSDFEFIDSIGDSEFETFIQITEFDFI